MEFSDLISMSMSRKYPKEGDIFLVQPLHNVYYYGKVIQTQIRSRNSCVNGMNLIFIYDESSDTKDIPDDLSHCNFLISPVIINKLPWSRGYFETIGNICVTEYERKIPFGFWNFQSKTFVNAEGVPLTYKPKYWSDYGLASYAVVGEKIQDALNIKRSNGQISAFKEQ